MVFKTYNFVNDSLMSVTADLRKCLIISGIIAWSGCQLVSFPTALCLTGMGASPKLE